MTNATLNLDARQRAMLDEMGVKVWWPARAPAAASVPPVAPVQPNTEPHTESALEPAIEPAAAEAAIDATARPAPVVVQHKVQAAVPPASVAARSDGVLVDVPRLLHGADNARGGWLVVADMPPEADGRHGDPFAGDAGRLLENMLRALQLHAGPTPVHLMRTHRGVAAAPSALQPSASQPFDAHCTAQAEALAPRVVLAMGPLAAQSLLQSAEPLGKLRGRAGHAAALGSVPVVATYHPAYLVRMPADKARAWADLCLAAELFDRAGA